MASTGGRSTVRVAVLIALSPRKLGSLEDWVVAFAAAARRSGHSLDVYGLDPIHPEVLDQLRRHGAGWGTIAGLVKSPLAAARRLAAQYDVIHLNLFQPRELPVLVSCAAWPARVLIVDHDSRRDHQPSLATPIRRRLDRAVLGRVAGLAGVSRYVRDRICARYALGDAHVRTIYNGVDLARFTPPTTRSGAVGAVHVMTAAYLIKEKGIAHLMRAMTAPRLRDARLSIVGDGPELDSLMALGRTLGIAERTTFLGLRSDLHLLLRDADIFVHPAVWEEAFGLTIAEAMAAACPVVASRVGAIPELIADGETGMLVPPGDPESLAVALERLAYDPMVRDRIGRAARRSAEERFGIEQCVEAHLAWCLEAVHGRSGRRHQGAPAARNSVAASDAVDEVSPPLPVAVSREVPRRRFPEEPRRAIPREEHVAPPPRGA
jgi:glycosyltransferase involved in cell wall biosynthesis